eukprot:3199225-Pyramimonas_sp.AAC.1
MPQVLGPSRPRYVIQRAAMFPLPYPFNDQVSHLLGRCRQQRGRSTFSGLDLGRADQVPTDARRR